MYCLSDDVNFFLGGGGNINLTNYKRNFSYRRVKKLELNMNKTIHEHYTKPKSAIKLQLHVIKSSENITKFKCLVTALRIEMRFMMKLGEY
jgi:hypothetical protein